jgi:hypothetical protein
VSLVDIVISWFCPEIPISAKAPKSSATFVPPKTTSS